MHRISWLLRGQHRMTKFLNHLVFKKHWMQGNTSHQPASGPSSRVDWSKQKAKEVSSKRRSSIGSWSSGMAKDVHTWLPLSRHSCFSTVMCTCSSYCHCLLLFTTFTVQCWKNYNTVASDRISLRCIFIRVKLIWVEFGGMIASTAYDQRCIKHPTFATSTSHPGKVSHPFHVNLPHER